MKYLGIMLGKGYTQGAPISFNPNILIHVPNVIPANYEIHFQHLSGGFT
jgi:hypothetical protein